MPQSKSLLAYRDLIEGILDRALDSERGIRLDFHAPGEAFSLRMRLYSAIRQLRRQAREIYPPEHNLHNRTPYDALVIKVDGASLEVRKTTPESIGEALGAKVTEL